MKIITCTAARNIQRTIGTRRAAAYLRNRGVPLVVSLYWLAGRGLV